MRTRVRLVALVAVASALSATLAFAQSHAGKRGKPVKSTAPRSSASIDKTDAGPSPDAVNEARDGGVDAAIETTAPAATLSPDAGLEDEALDGGVRPSPLNPAIEELPRRNADAGAPVDVDRLLADVAALRARVAAVSDTLYRSRLTLSVESEASRTRLASLVVSVDDGVVFVAPKAFTAAEPIAVFDHAVAPGRHAVTVEAERVDGPSEAFRTKQQSRFIVEVPRDQKMDVRIRLLDESTMGKDFPADREGDYDLRVRVRATAKPAGS